MSTNYFCFVETENTCRYLTNFLMRAHFLINFTMRALKSLSNRSKCKHEGETKDIVEHLVIAKVDVGTNYLCICYNSFKFILNQAQKVCEQHKYVHQIFKCKYDV